MTRISCKDAADASCTIATLLADLEQPCQMCGGDGVVVLTGRSPTGEPVTVRMLPELVLEVDGCEDLLAEIRARRCPHGR